jgi:26S proteasome regulatory subunit N5
MRYLLTALNKKRSQSSNAVTSMVKFALNEAYQNLNEDEKLKLLKTLIEITEGRIFVEYEYSVAIKRLTDIHLSRGDIEEAAKCIQDIQIETFGSLERAYKVDYILFQMRILLRKEDYIRVLIVSNKITRKHLNEEGLEKLKYEFYSLMIKYYSHEERFIDASKSYKTLFDFVKEIEIKLESNSTNSISETSLKNMTEILSQNTKKNLFENYILFLSICPPELETKNMFNELNMFYKKDLEENSEINEVVKKRLSDDIVFINASFLEKYLKFSIFKRDSDNPNAEKHWNLFRKFWIQHNIVIFERYFSQMSIQKISNMIGIQVKEVESEISDMVINNYIYAKINRIASTVNFRKRQDTGDKLNDLNSDLIRMLEKLETTCHLIHKENLKYDIK